MAAQFDIGSGRLPDRLEVWEAEIQQYTKAKSVRVGFLDRYFDPELAIPREASNSSLASAEVERIVNQLAIVRVAGSMPRRLGIEANDQELSLDRKRAKRVAHALDQSLRAWRPSNRRSFGFNEEVIRREGAQLEWDKFAGEHRATVYTSIRLVATWSVKNDELRWGRSAVVNLMNELSWIIYALRD
jgi:hypothetical protein